jgi:RHS repeat-associated protein
MTNLSSGTATIGWQYDRSGRVTRTTYPGGVTTDQTWDGAARLTSRTHKTNNATQQSFTYTYDKNGNRTNETRNLDGVGNSTSAETINYDYDTDDRLTNVTYSDGRSETYTLDANGNRRQITRSGYAAGSYSNENGTTINAFDARGRIENKQTPSGTITYTWDAAGNLKEVRRGTETTTYTWNPENQLIAIQQNGAPIATYRYTQGLRDQVQTSGETNRTVWNDGFAFLKQDHSGNTLTRTEHAGTKAIYLTGAYGNEILLRDGLDSVTGSVVNGALQSRTDYGSWGEATQTGTTQSNHGYTGHLQDDTGLIYARARYYDPSIGRFISKDPLEGLQNSPISWNAYLYANANPFYYVDPSGEIPIAVPIIIGGLALADYLLSDKREQAQELIQPESYAGFVGAEAYAFSQATANTLSLGYYDRVKQEGWGGYASQTRNITGATHFDAVQREIFAEGGDPVLAGLHATAGTSQAMLMAGMTAPMVQRTGAVLQNSSQRAGTWVREKVDSVLIKEGNSIATAVEVNATTRSVVSGAETRGGVATATGSSLQAKWGHLSASERRALLEVKAEANAFRRLQEMEAAMPRAHYLERHGAQLNLQSQFDRVAYGFNPTTGAQQYIPSAATRFMSHRDQLNVIMRSENIYRATGDVFLARRPIRFDSVVGSGFQRDSLNYGVQYSGRALLDSSGKAVSAFPVWGNK